MAATIRGTRVLGPAYSVDLKMSSLPSAFNTVFPCVWCWQQNQGLTHARQELFTGQYQTNQQIWLDLLKETFRKMRTLGWPDVLGTLGCHK